MLKGKDGNLFNGVGGRRRQSPQPQRMNVWKFILLTPISVFLIVKRNCVFRYREFFFFFQNESAYIFSFKVFMHCSLTHIQKKKISDWKHLLFKNLFWVFFLVSYDNLLFFEWKNFFLWLWQKINSENSMWFLSLNPKELPKLILYC